MTAVSNRDLYPAKQRCAGRDGELIGEYTVRCPVCRTHFKRNPNGSLKLHPHKDWRIHQEQGQ